MTYVRIPGKPVPWSRAEGRGKRRFNRPEMMRAQAAIRAAAIEAGVELIDGPVLVKAHFSYIPPKSWSANKRREALGTWKTSTPDVDNLFKNVSDALQGVAFTDDRYLACGWKAKMWGAEYFTALWIEPAPDRVPMTGVQL